MSLDLGYYGERNARSVTLPFINKGMWPNATPQIIVVRPDKRVYLVSENISVTTNGLVWNIKPEDVCVSGCGSVQVIYKQTNGDILGKDPEISTYIAQSADIDTTPLDPYEPQILRLINAAATASTSATSAAASASSASASATSASGSATSAGSSATSAAASATSASASAASAESSESSAAASATSAESSKNIAVSAKEASASSAASALASAQNATASENNALVYKNSAETSASNALASATSASQSAQYASESAESIGSSVTAAESAKAAAQGSATSAAGSASSAESASENAVSAKNRSEEILSQMTSDKEWVLSQKEDIVTLKTAAETAKTAAESAAAGVNKVNATVSKTGTVATITMTDKNGSTTTATVQDGVIGADGKPGVYLQDTAPTDADARVWLKETSAQTVKLLTESDMPSIPVKGVQVAGTDLTPDDNGKVNVPKTSASTYGVAKVGDYGIGISSGGVLKVNGASESVISARNSMFTPIVPSMLNTAVKASLTDANRLSMTSSEQDNACEVIGAERNGGWEIVTNTLTEDGILSVTLDNYVEIAHAHLTIPSTGSYGSGYIDTTVKDVQGINRTLHATYHGAGSSGSTKNAKLFFTHGALISTAFTSSDQIATNAIVYTGIYPVAIKQIYTTATMPAGSKITVWYRK